MPLLSEFAQWGFSDQLCQKGTFLSQARYPSIRGRLSLSTNLREGLFSETELPISLILGDPHEVYRNPIRQDRLIPAFPYRTLEFPTTEVVVLRSYPYLHIVFVAIIACAGPCARTPCLVIASGQPAITPGTARAGALGGLTALRRRKAPQTHEIAFSQRRVGRVGV